MGERVEISDAISCFGQRAVLLDDKFWSAERQRRGERGRPVRGERAAALVVDGLGDAEKTISGLKQVIHSVSCSHDSPPSG
jgi:hypothetical protein